MVDHARSTVRVPVLRYNRYLGPDSQDIYETLSFCGSCHRDVGRPYGYPGFPENLEEANETRRGWHSFERVGDSDPLEHFAFCPWCGAEFEDEWWTDRTIQNERVIDHYQSPGTHKGDRHEFRGSSPDCVANHWLAVSGGGKLCWCDPDVEPGIMGCVVRHQDKRYEDYVALQREMESDDDDE